MMFRGSRPRLHDAPHKSCISIEPDGFVCRLDVLSAVPECRPYVIIDLGKPQSFSRGFSNVMRLCALPTKDSAFVKFPEIKRNLPVIHEQAALLASKIFEFDYHRPSPKLSAELSVIFGQIVNAPEGRSLKFRKASS
jgi:hypothetical protein